jgi:PAS domain S-box-containing protein
VLFGQGSLGTVRNVLNWSESILYAASLLVGSALLTYSYARAQEPALKKQLKWIIWGLGFSIVPVTGLYLVPELAGLQVTPTMEMIAYGPLILLPLSFGYSIVRYRLMDVDVIMRRSFVHVVAVVAVGAIYMAVLLGVSDLVKFIWETADLNSLNTRIVVVAGMLLVALLLAPIRNKLQTWADRLFYGERYTLRMGLQDFGRTLAQTTVLPQLLNSLVRRLSEMLSVEGIAIFIEDRASETGFRLAHSGGLNREPQLPQNVKLIIRTRSIGRGFITENDLAPASADSSIAAGREASPAGELYYYIPCVVRDRMVAIIGLGRTASGALLSSEDTELLKTLSGYVAVAIDNSLLYLAEKENAEELARLKDFSENVIESVPVGILVIDLSGRVTTWNAGLEEMFGINRETALGRGAEELLDADLIETIRSATGREGWRISHDCHIYKFSTDTADRGSLTINVSLAPFEAARGVVSGTLMVIENVTERAQLEEQLLQREKLSSIGLLAAGVAHEVNTPLAGISSYSQMLLQQVPDSDPKHDLLQKIHSQTVRASGIVSSLLNFSRTGDARFQEVDLNSVLEDTLKLVEPQLHNTKVEIVTSYSPDLPPAFANSSKLQQVFMNLILNARDAMPTGGRLMIATRLVESSIVVGFVDTGVGIAPENIARIYDPFFTTKEVGQGTGLGLALSYGIIQEHGGRIFVESRPGEGAHFTLKLPTAASRHLQAAGD